MEDFRQKSWGSSNNIKALQKRTMRSSKQTCATKYHKDSENDVKFKHLKRRNSICCKNKICLSCSWPLTVSHEWQRGHSFHKVKVILCRNLITEAFSLRDTQQMRWQVLYWKQWDVYVIWWDPSPFCSRCQKCWKLWVGYERTLFWTN